MRRLSEVAARCSLTLVALGAGTAPGEPAGNEDGILVRFDLMRGIRPPERGAGWVEAEPGATWLDLDKELRRTGEGLAVYPTSAPRATVGGWLATVGGLGVGSFEYGRLRENVLSASVVTRGGGLREAGGEELGTSSDRAGRPASSWGPGSEPDAPTRTCPSRPPSRGPTTRWRPWRNW
ncbi:MAG TPA: FAD-dependent oxidoreductase [Rubrobacteraceae bacterium]|nr:FAD-dependent oxidoreductase [Rubrobacteraceae bacterium]